MANFYLRLPHYVASYFRNKDKQKEIPVNQPVVIDRFDPLWCLFSAMLRRNSVEEIVRNGCFCQHQWERMMRGEYLYPNAGHYPFSDDSSAPAERITLKDDEVWHMAGLLPQKNKDACEYLCIAIPEEMELDGALCRTDEYWQLRQVGAYRMAAAMNAEFWRACLLYIDKDYDWCLARNIDRALMDALERFMERYNIRNSPENREKSTMKRNLYRKMKNYRFNEDDFVEHADEADIHGAAKKPNPCVRMGKR